MTPLSTKMLDRADRDGLPEHDPLRVLAYQFENATSRFYADPQKMGVKEFMGCWSRARSAWCDYSGEVLV